MNNKAVITKLAGVNKTDSLLVKTGKIDSGKKVLLEATVKYVNKLQLEEILYTKKEESKNEK